MRVQRIPGLSLAVGRAGHVVFARGYGKADLEHDVPVTPTTLFRLQSTQKLLTATAVLRLAELGRLRLDDPVQRYCAAFGVRPWPVTVGDLLTHQGGVRSSDLADLFNREHYPSPAAAVRRFVRDTLAHRPGTRVLYSNAGYTLLACAIEGVTGQPYDSALATLVLRPSGMTATRDDNVYEVMPGRARYYVVRTAANTEQWRGLWTDAHSPPPASTSRPTPTRWIPAGPPARGATSARRRTWCGSDWRSPAGGCYAEHGATVPSPTSRFASPPRQPVARWEAGCSIPTAVTSHGCSAAPGTARSGWRWTPATGSWWRSPPTSSSINRRSWWASW
jgi:CubicO group peptidase (beta-lactamase class C family)